MPFDITINGHHVCQYIADFVYDQMTYAICANGVRVRRGFTARITEDSKGVRTDVYKLKKKLMLAVHGIAIKET